MFTNLFLTALLVYTFFRGHRNVDKRVADGLMTPEQGASYKRIVRPGAALGVVCGVIVILLDVMGA